MAWKFTIVDLAYNQAGFLVMATRSFMLGEESHTILLRALMIHYPWFATVYLGHKQGNAFAYGFFSI